MSTPIVTIITITYNAEIVIEKLFKVFLIKHILILNT